jgi:hypothetical protein
MRIIWAALAAAMLALVACGNAEATDFTLRYAHPEVADLTLTVEAGGDGRLRVEDNQGQWMIVRDGQAYVGVETPSRARVVARLDDYLAVGAERRAALIRNGALDAGAARQAYSLRTQGPRTVGQWRGIAYEVAPNEAPGVLMRLVISDDPAFADIRARAVAALQQFERPSHAVLIYPAAYDRLAQETLARGMPITYNGLNLRSVSRDRVQPTRFDLPGSPLSRDALRSAMTP